MAALGLAPNECHFLAYVVAYGPCPIGELVRVFGYKKPTMTAILDRLEERGLVARKSNPADRRSFVVKATATGRRLSAKARKPVDRLNGEIEKRVSKRDLDGFARVMAAIHEITGVEVRQDSGRRPGANQRADSPSLTRRRRKNA
jgi:DNA-binding MarR family transcriptional regulator